MSFRFDETDCRIVQALFENSRITNADLAKRIHMSESQCSRRLHRIEQAGIITGYTALVDYEALDLHAYAYLALTLDHSKTTRDATETAIRERPEVVYGYRTAGDSDYVVSVLTPDLSAFQRSIDGFNGMDGVAVSRSLLVLDPFKLVTKIRFPCAQLVSPAYEQALDAGANRAATGAPSRPLRLATVTRTSQPALRGDLARSKLDQIDLEIIRHLADNSRLSLVELGEKVGLSAAPCGRRVHTLERDGVLRHYTAKVSFDAVGLTTTVFIRIRFGLTNERERRAFARALLEAPQVHEAHRTHGESDYLIMVVVEDLAACDRFLSEVVLTAAGVIAVQSTPVLKLFHSRR